MKLVAMEFATKMQQLLPGSASRPHQQQHKKEKKKNKSIRAVQSATLRRSRSADAIGTPAPSEAPRLRLQLGIRAGVARSADSNSSTPPLNTNQYLSGKFHSSSTNAKRSSSHRCQVLEWVLDSAIAAQALTHIEADPSRVYQDGSEPLVNEEAEGAFQVPVGNLRAILRLWDIDNDKTNYHDLLAVVDYLERLGLDVYFRKEVKAILDRVFRVWTENSLTKTAAILGDLQVVGLAFYLLRSHQYDIQPSIFELYKKEDGSFCKTPKQGSGDNAPSADLIDILNLLRASELKFRRDAILHDAYQFASTALTSLLDGAEQPPLSEKTSAEAKYRLSYPWAMNFRMSETRQTIVNFDVESVTAKFSSARLSSEVMSLMLSTASQLFNHYHSVLQKELAACKRWSEETGCAEVNVRPALILRPFHLGYGYDLPQARHAYSREVWAKVWYLMILLDDIYEGEAAYNMDELIIFIDAFRKFDPLVLEKIPNIQDERYKFMKVLYRTMYDLTIAMAEESSKWYGRDLLQTFIQMWLIRLEIYLTEKRWAEARYKFTIEEYVEEYGKWSFVVETGCPFGYYAIPGWTLSPSFFETRADMGSLLAMAKSARFFNDARSFEHEKVEDGKTEFITLLMEANPGFTLEDAIKQTQELGLSAMEEATEEILQSQVPHQVKQIIISNYRTLMMMYFTVDGLRDGGWALADLCDPVPTFTTEN